MTISWPCTTTCAAARVLEPRGHNAMVAALLTSPVQAGSTTGVIFMNDVGVLGMCGHGLIGVIKTLQYLGRISYETVQVDTVAGTVMASASSDGTISITNVPSSCTRFDVEIDLDGRRYRGDIAYGGNWFFLVDADDDTIIDISNVERLMSLTRALRARLYAAGITGDDGSVIDHVELTGPPQRLGADSRNFVLCPGNAYDRSPCGTGTSAKMASLYARGKLPLGQAWRQEGILGSVFVGRLSGEGGGLVPTITADAHITSEARLIFEDADPFRSGIRT